jgi:hypothetical protein
VTLLSPSLLHLHSGYHTHDIISTLIDITWLRPVDIAEGWDSRKQEDGKKADLALLFHRDSVKKRKLKHYRPDPGDTPIRPNASVYTSSYPAQP